MPMANDGKIRLDGYADGDLKLVVTGDLCPLADVEEEFLAGRGTEVYGEMLDEVLDKDLSLTNLELALTRGGEPIDKCGPNLRADPDIFPAMAAADFDVYGVANNHSRDWGDAAFLETLGYIEAAGKKHVGGGRNTKDAARPLRVRVRGRNLTFLAVTMHTPCDAGGSTPGAAGLDHARTATEICRARAAGDLVIVYFHDGKEHVPFPSARIRNYCRAFVEAGACAVIGHHPHMSRGFEIYEGGLIAYSLGNFLFPRRREQAEDRPPFWYEGYALRLRLGPAGLTGLDVIPHRYDPAGRTLKRINGDGRRDRFFARLHRLNELLAEPGENDRYFSAAAAQFPHYMNVVRDFCDDQLNGCDDRERAARNGKVFYHYLNTEEHWDILDAISHRQWQGIADVPADLKELYY